jgi:hypothetical protein
LGHPDITNRTPFAFEPVFIGDEDLRPVVVTVVKGTFAFDAHGDLWLAEDQLPINLAGEPATPAPVSSYKYEPEIAFWKAATDIVLIGHAQPPAGGVTQLDVGIRVGPVQRVARVFGDRFWVMANQTARMSRTLAVGRVPLIWENAFGGHDEVGSTPQRALLEQRNPVGTGFGRPLRRDDDYLRLPNIEDPNQLIGQYGVAVTPCGFGFTSPSWQPRASFAGTYDENWNKTRKPMLPIDFDRRFFNAAAPGLVAPGYLHGHEEVVVLNSASVPRLAFRLPSVPAPQCRVVLRGKRDTQLQTNLDTVIVNTDENQLILLWRAYATTGGGPHDVVAIEVRPAD